jgi:DNA-binding MurR/RpiR family transcriptional regulator
MTDILAKIDVSKLTDTDRIILKYVQDNRERVAWMTLSELCSKLFISNASIVRFTQKLGCNGFSEFKFKLRNSDTVNDKKIDNILPEIAARFDDTIAGLDETQVTEICRSILTRQPFYIYGRNVSSIPASYLYDMLTTMDISCMFIDWIDTLRSLSETISSNSLVLMMSEHCHEEYMPIIKALHSRGAKIIWICSSKVHPEIEKSVDLFVDTGSENEQSNKLATLVIIQAIIEYIETQKVPS